MKREEYERLKAIALKKIENQDIKIAQHYENKSSDELVQINEIYQAELEAQNEELQTHILDLETAQKELEILFTHAPIPYLLMTSKFQVLRANENIFSMFSSATILSNKIPFYAYIYKGHLTRFLHWINSPDEKHTPIEIIIKTKNGFKYCVLHYFRWTKHNNDTFLLSIIDIHAQKEESDRFKALFENTQHGVMYIDKDKTIVELNQKAKEVIEAKKEFIKKKYTELSWTFLDADDQVLHVSELPFAKALKTKKRQKATVFAVYRQETKSKIWLKMEANPHFSLENEELLGVFCIFTDVSQEIILNQKVHQQLENFKTLGNNIPDVILRIDEQKNILFANKKAHEFFKLNPEQIDKIKLCNLFLFETNQAKDMCSTLNKLSELSNPVSYSLSQKVHKHNKNYFVRIVPEKTNGFKKIFLVIVEDITQRIQSEEMFNQLFFNASDAIVLTDHHSGKIKSINAKARKLFNIDGDNFTDKDSRDIFESFKSEKNYEKHIYALEKFGVDSYETTRKSQNEDMQYLKVFCTLINIGEETFHQSIVHDLTEHKLLELQLQQTSKVFEHTAEGILITNLEGIVVSANEAFTKITGYSKEEIVGNRPSLLQSKRHDLNFYKKMWKEITQKGVFKGEIWNKKKDGAIYPEWITISTIYDENENPIQYVAVFSDFSEIKKTQRKLESLAHYDTLTQLPNRLLLHEQIKQSIKMSNRNKHPFAVLFIDLDRFKQINDTHGHGVGDEVLIMTAQRLQKVLRKTDIVSRLGGDEFVVVVNEIKDFANIDKIANNILVKLQEPFCVDGYEHYISASIGVSVYPQDTQDDDVNTLLKHADIAMYESKSAGKNNYHMFSSEMAESVKMLSTLHNNLNTALSKNEFYLVYQPQYDVLKNKILGFEALLRWRNSNSEEIMPSDFIPYAEESKLIIPIGKWVLEQAIEDYYKIKKLFKSKFTISVNVSHVQLNQEFINVLEYLVAKHQDFSSIIKLEITETAAMQNLQNTQEVIKEIKKLGFKISLDDFGTGYSALSAIKTLRVDELKIDRAFVKDVPGDKDDEELISVIIAMAKVMKKNVVAEGVETIETRDFLTQRRCSVIQGYLIAKPMKLEETLEFIKNNK